MRRTACLLAVGLTLGLPGWGCGDSTGDEPRCGDGEVNQALEECDGADLRGYTCADLGLSGADLGCTTACRYDTTACGPPCGDGHADVGQDCDGADLGGATCESLGHYGEGTLACAPGCTYDESACERCGDGVIQAGEGEECDGGELGGETCESLGYYGGTLECGTGCEFDVSDCAREGRCGDGEIQTSDGEECDGNDLNGADCLALGAFGGTPLCTGCQLDLAGCERVVQVGAAEKHTCVVTSQMRVYCWGADGDGQLGNGTAYASRTPVPVQSSINFVAVDGGMAHTCALSQNGVAFCWGQGTRGQIGNGLLSDRDVPTMVVQPAGVTFTALDVGGVSACALDQAGDAWCWGGGNYGALGNGGSDDESEPTPVSMPADTQFTRISCGRLHCCALDQGGNAWCWGNNEDGELGRGFTTFREETPGAVQMPANTTFTEISAGLRFTCALDQSGDAWCWGGSAYGHISCALGDGTCDGATTPVPVVMNGAGSFQTIATAYNFVCALTPAGRLWCWGWGPQGQLAWDSGSGCYCNATWADGNQTFVALSASESHGCAADDHGGAWCWGLGDDGRLGDGTTNDANAPQAVDPP